MSDIKKLESLAESDHHLQWLVARHLPPKGKTFCPVCDSRSPCDYLSLAISGLARSAEIERLREQVRNLHRRLSKAGLEDAALYAENRRLNAALIEIASQATQGINTEYGGEIIRQIEVMARTALREEGYR
jgi:hypothetical protein